MPKKPEYRILPQGERDDYHSHIRSGDSRVTTQYFCVFAFTLAAIVLILAGVATLTASMFYSDQVSKTFGHFWFNYSVQSSTTASSLTVQSESSSHLDHLFSSHTEDYDKVNHTTTVAANGNNSSISANKNKTHHESNKVHHHHRHSFAHAHQNTSRNSSDSIGESGLRDFGNFTESSESDEEEDSDNMENQQALDMEDLKEKFAETMRDLEKRMENITGIRKAEFVIPIFMLIAFLVLFSMVSLCCCILMKRKDKRRRKLFGKLITDLQTGDSKTVLLNNMDLDD